MKKFLFAILVLSVLAVGAFAAPRPGGALDGVQQIEAAIPAAAVIVTPIEVVSVYSPGPLYFTGALVTAPAPAIIWTGQLSEYRTMTAAEPIPIVLSDKPDKLIEVSPAVDYFLLL